MAKVYGTNNLDVLDGWFDGVTDRDDTIFGYGGTDWIHGLNGNDILQGGEGADYLFGGNGQDTANYGDSPVGVYVNLQTTEGHSGGIAKLSFLRGRRSRIQARWRFFVAVDARQILLGHGGIYDAFPEELRAPKGLHK
jgi:Ca2+-binding RTX toxin-like protein